MYKYVVYVWVFKGYLCEAGGQAANNQQLIFCHYEGTHIPWNLTMQCILFGLDCEEAKVIQTGLQNAMRKFLKTFTLFNPTRASKRGQTINQSNFFYCNCNTSHKNPFEQSSGAATFLSVQLDSYPCLCWHQISIFPSVHQILT